MNGPTIARERFMPDFQLVSDFAPAGDQPHAIDALFEGITNGRREQVLMGVTGSGKTFTMANVIARLNRPALILSHNKTLAAQLYSEFREFFPHNAVSYFVSYYDYYQPEAYIPQRDNYIEMSKIDKSAIVWYKDTPRCDPRLDDTPKISNLWNTNLIEY